MKKQTTKKNSDVVFGGLSKKGIGFGLLLWVIVFSIGLVLKHYRDAGVIDARAMRIVLVLVGSGLAFCFYWALNRRGGLTRAIANSFFVVNSLLDIIVLMGIFHRNLFEWLGSVFIFYIFVFYGLYYMFDTKKY